MQTKTPARSDLRSIALIPYVIIAFGISWGIVGLWVAIPDRMQALFGEISGTHPLFILAVYAPAIAAVFLVMRQGGWSGLRRYLTRLTLWRCHPGWYALMLLGIPAIYYAGAAVKGDISSDPAVVSGFGAMLMALFLRLIIGPVEEFGWRGVMQPLVQRWMAPFWAALVVGTVWGLWHLPAFFLSGTPQSAWDFTPFFLGSIAVSVMVTGLFNATGGSILLPALFHWQLNNPIFPDAQPYDTWFFVGAAAVVVMLDRKSMFARAGAATRVIPDG